MGPCPTLINPHVQAESGQITWVFQDPEATTVLDERISAVETPCTGSLSVLRDPDRPFDTVADGEMVNLHFQVSMGCLYADQEDDGAGISFQIPTDLRREMEGARLSYDTVRPDLGYHPNGGGQHCRWNSLPLYSEVEGTPEGHLVIEVLSATGSEVPYPTFVSSDFEMRLRVTYTAPSSFVGYQQIDGFLEPCPRAIESVDTSFEVALTATQFDFDPDRFCGTGG
jgi:hypothetical protein